MQKAVRRTLMKLSPDVALLTLQERINHRWSWTTGRDQEGHPQRQRLKCFRQLRIGQPQWGHILKPQRSFRQVPELNLKPRNSKEIWIPTFPGYQNFYCRLNSTKISRDICSFPPFLILKSAKLQIPTPWISKAAWRNFHQHLRREIRLS